MKIPLTIMNWGGKRIVLIMTVRIPQLHINKTIKAVIDTGSPQSFIGINDAKLMQIPFAQLEHIQTIFIGGETCSNIFAKQRDYTKIIKQRTKTPRIKFSNVNKFGTRI